jgi:hypothetical protein
MAKLEERRRNNHARYELGHGLLRAPCTVEHHIIVAPSNFNNLILACALKGQGYPSICCEERHPGPATLATAGSSWSLPALYLTIHDGRFRVPCFGPPSSTIAF